MKAYPFLHKHPTTGNTTMSDGMDLRDWLAGLAMQGFVASGAYNDINFTRGEIAEFAYKMADAMIEERKDVPNE